MLTSTQVCERLGISRNTLRKYIDRGYLTAAFVSAFVLDRRYGLAR